VYDKENVRYEETRAGQGRLAYNENVDRKGFLHTLEHSLTFLGCGRSHGGQHEKDKGAERSVSLTLEDTKDGIGISVMESDTRNLLLDESTLSTSFVVCEQPMNIISKLIQKVDEGCAATHI